MRHNEPQSNHRRARDLKLVALTLATVVLLVASCTPSAPEPSIGANTVEVLFVSPDGGASVLTPQAMKERVIQLIDEAEATVDAAFEYLEDVDVARALVRARDRGVRVRVVGDEDHRDQAGFVVLDTEGVESVFGNGTIFWNPQPAVEVLRVGEDNRMTHNFVIADELFVVAMTGGFPSDYDIRSQQGFFMRSQWAAKDFGDEFQQLFGGVFATTLTLYGAPISAATNNRTRYILDQPRVMEIYFGPQDPILKQIIDDVYAARGSVYVAAEVFSNRDLANALRYKAEVGFDVRVVVGPDAVSTPYSQVEGLSAAFAEIRAREGTPFPQLVLGPHLAENVVLIDTAASPVDGVRYPASLMVTTLPFFASIPYEITPSGPVSRPAALFSDSNMWVIREQPTAADADIVAAVERFGTLTRRQP